MEELSTFRGGVEARIGDDVEETAPIIDGYICKNPIARKTIGELDKLFPLVFQYLKKKWRVKFDLPAEARLSEKDRIQYQDFDQNVIKVPAVLYPIDSLGGEWYIDEDRTILAEYSNGYLALPNTDLSDGEYTDITFYGSIKQKPLQTLLDIGDEVDFKKVLIVESSDGRRERITQDIYDMYDRYHRVYGDNGVISDFDKPIWRVVSKL